ncbi:HAD hydrolase-like protein, partial [Alcaligenes pakistanensis]
ADCLYVGDDLRDIQAGQAAGMATMIAAYGYCADDDSIGTWQADLTVHHT